MLKSISYLLFVVLLLSPFSCGKDNIGPVYLQTTVCFKTQHHERAVPFIKTYLKYGTDSFPGYDDLSRFDTMIVSNDFGDVCFPHVPPGKHWVVGIGMDDVLQEPVRGGLPFEIVTVHAPWDTTLYISEY